MLVTKASEIHKGQKKITRRPESLIKFCLIGLFYAEKEVVQNSPRVIGSALILSGGLQVSRTPGHSHDVPHMIRYSSRIVRRNSTAGAVPNLQTWKGVKPHMHREPGDTFKPSHPPNRKRHAAHLEGARRLSKATAQSRTGNCRRRSVYPLNRS